MELKQQLKFHRARIKTLSEANTEVTGKLAKLTQKEAEAIGAIVQKDFDALMAKHSLKLASKNVKLTVVSSTNTCSDDDDDMDCDGNRKKVDDNIRFEIVTTSYGSRTAIFNTKMKPSKEILELRVQKKYIEKMLEFIAKAICEIEDSIRDIPALERQARAAMATQALSSTEQGRSILNNMKTTKLIGSGESTGA